MAVTLCAWLIVTTQGVVPVHPPPLHPLNVLPALGAAVTVTLCPALNEVAQVPGQLIPAGLLVTTPLPPPVAVTVSW